MGHDRQALTALAAALCMGAAAIVGAYEETYTNAPSQFIHESPTAATTVLLAAALGYVATAFHENYEQLAPLYGWETQEASRTKWNDLPDHQRRLMIHTVGNVLAELRGGLHFS